MSASNELEDSLQACREIQLQIGSEVTISDEEENLLETQDEIPVREEEESREEKPHKAGGGPDYLLAHGL